MTDLIILGGGVIGLSLAYETSGRGAEVLVIDVKKPGQASRAGAGILVPTNEQTAIHPLEKIRGLSSRLHAQWASQLLSETGIDNGYRPCGGVYVARTVGEVAALRGVVEDWTDFEIDFQRLTDQQLVELVPSIARLDEHLRPTKSVWVASESQITNPAHLNALTAACKNHGVKFLNEVESIRLARSTDKIEFVEADGRSFDAAAFCIAAGSWSEQLLQQIDISMPMVPVRGQVVLYKLEQRLFDPVIYEGSRYIVPRVDGHVLVGATVEEVGFDATTEQTEIDGLKDFAASLIPELDETTYKKSWAGLRPATNDGFPYMGPISGLCNAYVSTGHFKSGLHLSTGSAVVMADLIEGKQNPIDLAPFDPARASFSKANLH